MVPENTLDRLKGFPYGWTQIEEESIKIFGEKWFIKLSGGYHTTFDMIFDTQDIFMSLVRKYGADPVEIISKMQEMADEMDQ